jgi:hypothetical protein
MTRRLHLATDADLPPAAEFGEPVSLDFADGSVDLGTEDRDGQRIVRLVVQDGLAHLALAPPEAQHGSQRPPLYRLWPGVSLGVLSA